MIDADKDFTAIRPKLKRLSFVGDERDYALFRAVRHVLARGLQGSFVECGVFQGGSVATMCLTLMQVGDTSRDIYLYDTFEGMTEPTDADVDLNGTAAKKQVHLKCVCDLETVKRNVLSTGYPSERLHFVQGRVEDTIPRVSPDTIALLRLDTDWYESTRHELVHLYPLLVTGGVLLIDDYGHWRGCRQAVDEFIAGRRTDAPFLQRIDYTGLMGVKP